MLLGFCIMIQAIKQINKLVLTYNLSNCVEVVADTLLSLISYTNRTDPHNLAAMYYGLYTV